jgi:hypothetical protein
MARNNLTPEERSKKQKEAMARRRQKLENESKGHVEGVKETTVEAPADASNEVITIHFVADGLTAFNNVWYKGQELSVEVGSDQYTETLDKEGNSWLLLDEFDQIDRWDEVKFRPGPWRGLPMGEAVKLADQIASEEDPDKRAKLEKKLARLGQPKGAPVVAR